MRKFIIKASVYFTIALLLFFAMAYMVKPDDKYSNHYMNALADKHEHMSSISGPRLIFSGGSNLAFGLDSKSVQEELSIPVVNLGLHAGLGLDFMLEVLKNSVRPKDIVVFSTEYYLEDKGNYELKKLATRYFNEARDYYPMEFKNEVEIFADETRSNLKNWMSGDSVVVSKDKVYGRHAFNEFGDAVAHLSKENPKELDARAIFQYTYWDGINDLNEFYAFAKEKDIEVFFMFPSYPNSEYKNNFSVIKQYGVDIEKNLDFQVLGIPEDFIFEDEMFFDTIYHLNSKGRDLRTELVKEKLKCVLGK